MGLGCRGVGGSPLCPRGGLGFPRGFQGVLGDPIPTSQCRVMWEGEVRGVRGVLG